MRLALLLVAVVALLAVSAFAESSPLTAQDSILKAKSADPKRCSDCPQCDYMCMSTMIGCYSNCRSSPTPSTCMNDCFAVQQTCGAQPTTFCTPPPVAVRPEQTIEQTILKEKAAPKRCVDCPQCNFMCTSTVISCFANCRASPAPGMCTSVCLAAQQACGALPTNLCNATSVAVRPEPMILKAKSDPKRCSDCPQCHYQCMAQMIGCYSNCRSSPTPAQCMTDCFNAQEACGAKPTDEQC